jgi:DNA-binding response OmpR family regulator
MRILIIEDDDFLRLSLKKALESEMYIVDHIGDGINGSYIARTHDYNLIIVDYILPGKDGLEVIQDIRKKGVNSPILVMSARGDIGDKVNLLESGADDYIVKPFTYQEFRARVHALLRRNYKIIEETMTIDDVTIDISKTEVLKNGEKVYLTKKEFMILQSLTRNPGHVITRAELLEEAWGRDTDPFSNTIEAHIRNLRKKIESEKRLIHTVPGRGYKIAAL